MRTFPEPAEAGPWGTVVMEAPCTASEKSGGCRLRRIRRTFRCESCRLITSTPRNFKVLRCRTSATPEFPTPDLRSGRKQRSGLSGGPFRSSSDEILSLPWEKSLVAISRALSTERRKTPGVPH